MSNFFTRAARMFTGGRSHLELRDFIPNSNQSLLHQYQHHQHEQESAARQEQQALMDAAAAGEKNTMNDVNASYGISPVASDADSTVKMLTDATQAIRSNQAAQAQAARAPGQGLFGSRGAGGLRTLLSGYGANQAANQLLGERANIEAAQNSPTAIAAGDNHRALEGILGGQRQNTLDTGMQSLDAGFGSALRAQQQRLAAQGLAGGSADAGMKAGLLRSYLGGRQQLAGAAQSADLNARQSLEDQRQRMLQDVKSGLTPDLGSINMLAQQRSSIRSAYDNVAPNAIGGLLANFGQLGASANLAGGYGYGPMAAPPGYGGGGGLALNNPRTSSSRGVYSGG